MIRYIIWDLKNDKHFVKSQRFDTKKEANKWISKYISEFGIRGDTKFYEPRAIGSIKIGV